MCKQNALFFGVIIVWLLAENLSHKFKLVCYCGRNIRNTALFWESLHTTERDAVKKKKKVKERTNRPVITSSDNSDLMSTIFFFLTRMAGVSVPKSKTGLLDLPTEILINIFSYLDYKSLCRLVKINLYIIFNTDDY